jgi:hypothetical protein
MEEDARGTLVSIQSAGRSLAPEGMPSLSHRVQAERACVLFSSSPDMCEELICLSGHHVTDVCIDAEQHTTFHAFLPLPRLPVRQGALVCSAARCSRSSV